MAQRSLRLVEVWCPLSSIFLTARGNPASENPLAPDIPDLSAGMLIFCIAVVLATALLPAQALLSRGQSYPPNTSEQSASEPLKLPIYPTSDRYQSLVLLVCERWSRVVHSIVPPQHCCHQRSRDAVA